MSLMERTLIIGGTGTIGRAVVEQMSATGAAVRAMVRNPEAARMPAQVEVVRGDLTVPETLDASLDGIAAVFLVWTAPATAAEPALERIAKYARRIVYLTAPIKTAHPLFQSSLPNRSSELHTRIEGLIESSGMQWTFLRPGMFASNALSWWAPQIRAGDVVRWPYPEVPTAPIHESDIAAVAVKALREEGHGGAEYVLTGPQSLSQAEQVETIGRVIGRFLRMTGISPDEARRELAAIIPAVAMDYLLKAWAGAAGQPAFVTNTVEEITGVPARTFRSWVSDHAAEFAASRGAA